MHESLVKTFRASVETFKTRTFAFPRVFPAFQKVTIGTVATVGADHVSAKTRELTHFPKTLIRIYEEKGYYDG